MHVYLTMEKWSPVQLNMPTILTPNKSFVFRGQTHLELNDSFRDMGNDGIHAKELIFVVNTFAFIGVWQPDVPHVHLFCSSWWVRLITCLFFQLNMYWLNESKISLTCFNPKDMLSLKPEVVIVWNNLFLPFESRTWDYAQVKIEWKYLKGSCYFKTFFVMCMAFGFSIGYLAMALKRKLNCSALN